MTWEECNAITEWVFAANEWKSIFTWNTFDTIAQPSKNKITTIDLVLRNDTENGELLLRHGYNYCKTEICEWRIAAASKINVDIEIVKNPRINEDLSIAGISKNKIITFESKSLSSCSGDPIQLKLNLINYMIVKGYALHYNNLDIFIQIFTVLNYFINFLIKEYYLEQI